MPTPRQTAEHLARHLHATQRDKAGRPYVGHLARVVAHLLARFPDASDAEIQAAWLHDAMEDTGADETSLLAAGILPEAVRLVRVLTRPPGSEYLAWIAQIAASADFPAIRIKLADNADNRDPSRTAALPGAAARVATRYDPARTILEAALPPVPRPRKTNNSFHIC